MPNHDLWEKKLNAKEKRRRAKKNKKPKMLVSGKSVFRLKKIIEK
ncbi:MAG: hypothetical protein WC752_01995 [Patescibacteria group bacterium]|jgi:hypothetical protein